ncbi:MAG TPA: hypothetical protein VM470_00945 [Acidimicrobiia bacterium]|nr:hypothetical protein [Acidimicrobiia bacterium]
MTLAGSITVSGVGFNPFRPTPTDRFDIVMVAAAVVVILVLLAWAIWG